MAGKRIRRTPEESKSLILKVASRRLGEYGLEGLNISGVAKEAGMSHATVIHHFGSTGAMREQLLKQMINALLSDVMDALAHEESADKVLDRLFTMLSQDGHGRLLAWLTLDQQTGGFGSAGSGTRQMFANIIDSIASRGSQSDAKHQVFLVTLAALGLGICGNELADLVGLDENEKNAFPAWLADHIKSFSA